MVTQETRVLRIAAVKAKTGLGTSAIYKKTGRRISKTHPAGCAHPRLA